MILAIDTCGSVGGLALADEGDAADPDVYFRQLAGKTFSELLIGTISELLNDADSALSQLTAVVVVHGPGSFTGIRIGVSAAKGLAEAVGIPLIAISRLELLARKAPSPATIALLDAGRGEFFVGVYRQLGEARHVREMEGLVPHKEAVSLAAQLGLPVVVCEELVRSALELPAYQLLDAPTAVDAVVLGSERWRRNAFDDVANVDANYLRRSETEMLARIAEHAAIRAAASIGQ